MNGTKATTMHKLIAIIAAVIIAFTMYTPLTAFADNDAQAQDAGAVKAQAAESDAGSKKADEDKDSSAESEDTDAEKADAGADRQDADDADSGSDDKDADAGDTDAADADNAGADADAEGADSDADGAAEDTESVSEDLDENMDLDEEIAGTLVNTDTPYRVTVTFGEEAGIPEGAELIVKEMPEADYIDQATAELNAGKVAFAVFLDISIVKDGEEIQPSDDVKVEVTLNDMPSEENGELAVVHFEEAEDAEAVKSSTEDATATFKADGFSVYGFVYTVEFTYGEYTFIIEGGSEILLSEIFSQLHIEEDLTGSETECSAPELFQIDPISSGDDTVTDWNLKSLEPFTTEETLTVNLANGDVVVITLTDDQPIETGKANPSGNVIWELYERDGKRVMEFKVLDPNASDEEKAITKIQKDGSTARIDNNDPLRTTTDKVIIHAGITGIGWTAVYNTSGYNPRLPGYPYDQSQTGVFQDFHTLTTVEIEAPGDIQRIGWSAFRRCYELKNINLSSMTNLKEILNQAFSPSGLEELDLSGCTSLEMIGHGMCSGASYADKQLLTSVKLPKNLKTIGSDAFTQCKKLKHVSFEDISSVTTIYNGAFKGTGSVANPIEYISDEATKQRAATRPAVRRLFTSVTSFPNDFIDYTGLDKNDWPLDVTVKDKTTTYNGEEQNGYEISSVPEGESDTCTVEGLKDGHKLSIPTDSPDSADPKGYTPSHGTTVAGSPYDNGTFADDPELDAIYEGYDYGINYYFDSKTPGKLTITKADLTITAKDQTYDYNGSAQGPAGTYTSGFDTYVEAEGLQGDDALTSITLSGQQTNAREYPDEIEPRAAVVGDATDNYNITYVKGKLTIDPIEATVTIVGHKDAKTYNGAQQSVTGYDFSADSDLYTENDFTFRGTAKASRTDAGTTRMGLASGQFQNTNSNFSKVTFNVTDGSIEIAKRSLTITTGSASKKYDGSALTSNKYSVSGLASGDAITVRTTGSRTAVGSSENTYTINWGKTKKSNYDITEKLGTLTVDEAGNNGGGGGGNNGGNNAPNGNANAVVAPAADGAPAANIADGDVPMADGTTIEDDPTPTAAPEDGSFWALLNLLMTLLTILIAILWIVLRRPEAAAKLRAGVIIVIALAILSVVILILTENFTLPMHIVDKWTPLMGLILVLEAVAAGVLRRTNTSEQE